MKVIFLVVTTWIVTLLAPLANAANWHCPPTAEEDNKYFQLYQGGPQNYASIKPYYEHKHLCYSQRAKEGKLSADEVRFNSFISGQPHQSATDLDRNAKILNPMAHDWIVRDAKLRLAATASMLCIITWTQQDLDKAKEYINEAISNNNSLAYQNIKAELMHVIANGKSHKIAENR